MTVFSNNPYDRRMERLMMTVPNFAPRGVGFRFTEAQVFITATAASSISYAVHSGDPIHLVGGFQVLGNTL